MAAATSGDGSDNGRGKRDVSGRTHPGGSPLAESAAGDDAAALPLPAWTKALGWCGVAGLIYLLVCALVIVLVGVL
ncbi:hypothetical protein [Streptomyces aureus]|uniref:hypothetical protein n=1 Tax=Streptomyces aureus TaxID=193461 RepID=UPI0036CC45F9